MLDERVTGPYAVPMATKKKSGAPIGCLFWVAFLILVIIMYVVNKPAIDRTLKNTGFWDAMKPAPTAPAQPVKPTAETPPDKSVTITVPRDKPDQKSASKPAPSTTKQAPDAAPLSPSPQTPPGAAKPTVNPKDQVLVKPQKPNTPSPATKPAPAENSVVIQAAPPEKSGQTATRKSVLYFVSVDSDGSINRQAVRRTVTYADSPLSDTIKVLLEGPTAEELKLGFLTLIPQGTKLLSAVVRGTTVYLNFSDSFQFNTMGIEGYAAQLKQVVYTATEFPNIHEVQILIDGEKHQYLGAEGVFIGGPLSRGDL